MNYQELIDKITQSILDNIAPLLQKALKHDKTFKAKVVEVINSGKVKILYSGKTHTASTTVSCKTGDIVRICVPSGNWQDLFVVENKTKKKLDSDAQLDNETILNMINEMSDQIYEVDNKVNTTTAKFDEYLPLNGEDVMSGNLRIEKASPTIWWDNTTKDNQACMQLYNNTISIYNRNIANDSSYFRRLSLTNSDGANIENCVNLQDTINGTSETYNIYGEHNQTFIRDYLYPVGSVVCMSSNTNPSTKYGGTWTLIDKEYKHQRIEIKPTFDAAESANIQAMLAGHTIDFYINYMTSATLTDTTTTLLTIDPASCGATRFGYTTRYYTAFSDVGNTVVTYGLTVDGVLSARDVIVRGSSSASVTFSETINNFQIIVTQYATDYMLDSFCDKFYFKRTA